MIPFLAREGLARLPVPAMRSLSLPLSTGCSWIPMAGAGGSAAAQPCSAPSGSSPLPAPGLLSSSSSTPGGGLGSCRSICRSPRGPPGAARAWAAPLAGQRRRLSASPRRLQPPRGSCRGGCSPRLQPGTAPSFPALSCGVGRLSLRRGRAFATGWHTSPGGGARVVLGWWCKPPAAPGWGCRRVLRGAGRCRGPLGGAGLPAPQLRSLLAALGSVGGSFGAGL